MTSRLSTSDHLLSTSMATDAHGAGPKQYEIFRSTRHDCPLPIAAGTPLLAQENREGEVPIAAASLPGRGEDVFALRVRGESMIEAHICDGDLVLVRRQSSAQPNDIVVAMVESEAGGETEATVKRFFRENGRIRLQPENESLEPLFPTHVQILGKVIGVFRRV